MADRLRAFTDDQLASALMDVGPRLAYPDLDVAPAVVGAIAAQPVARRVPRRAETRPGPGILERLLPRRPVRRAVALALALILLAATAAVAGRLGLPGLRIIFQPHGTTLPSPPPVGTHLFLGHRTTLAEARTEVSFPVLVPHDEGLGPAEVYVSIVPPGGTVSLVYRARPGLPAGRFTGAGALITEFRAGIDPAYVKKLVQTGTHIEFPEVRAEPAYWFSGQPHEIYFVDENGRPYPDSLRLAGNALVWTDGELTLRLECRCSQARALRIANSVR